MGIHLRPDGFAGGIRCTECSRKSVTGMKLISVAQNPTDITDVATAQKVMRLFERLDDYDDTMNVFSNFEIDDSILEQL